MSPAPMPSRRSTRRLLAALVGSASLLAACSSGGDDPATTAAPTTTELRATADSEAEGWAHYGHDLANTRRNPDETAITRDTVGELTEQWSIGEVVGVTGTPAVVDGTAYFADWTGTVWAVDAATGDEIWTSEVAGMLVPAPAVTVDAVYISGGSSLHRLDRATGEEQWAAVTNEHPLAQIAASPVVVGDLVLQGTASAEVVMPREDYTFRGSIGAYDAETGEERWRFYTTPEDGGAGVGVWSTPAVDEERGILYVGTGNNYDEPASELADSILAIEVATGELVWSTAFTAPDVWSAGNPRDKDADVGASPNLWSVGDQDLVGAGDKGGMYHALDRETGEVVWETQLTPGSMFGGEIGSAAFVDGRLIASSNVGNPENNAPLNKTKVLALDAIDGEVLWESEELEGKIFGPVGAVAGVAFVGTDEGLLLAFDVESGEELWRHEAPARTGGGPSIVDGRVLWGYGFTLFDGPGPGGVISFGLDT